MYDNITIAYNYSSVEDVLDDENNLVMYKCSSQESCTWNLLTTTLNTTTNIISAVVNSLSVFLVAETATTTTTETVTETIITSAGGGGGGGGSVVTKLVVLDIIVPSPLSMHLKDQILTPIFLKNKGNVKLKNITLTADTNAKGIDVEITNNHFDELGINETVSTDVVITTNFEKAERNEVTITATATEPDYSDSVKFIIDVIDKYEGNRTIIEEKIKFTADLFEENPECLELNELLLQAETALENNELEKARVLTESAINACRQLVGSQRLKPVREEMPTRFVGFNMILPLIIALLIVFLVLAIYYGAKRIRSIRWKKPRLKFRFLKRKHRMIGPTKKEVGTFESEEREIRRMLRRKRS
jgi:hypothetical protein